MVKMVGGLQGSTYPEKLRELGLQTLEDRRQEADLTLMYEVIRGECKVRGEKWYKMAEDTGHRTRATADPCRLEVPQSRLDIRRNIFTCRVPALWDSLPTSVRD